jgi:hypothetical protein
VRLYSRTGQRPDIPFPADCRSAGAAASSTVGRSHAKDGGTLRTIGEACNYMTNMGKKRELRDHWQRVCKLILAKEDVLTVGRALELALFMDAKLDVSKVAAK